MVADFCDAHVIIGKLILLFPPANYEVVIITKLCEGEARSVLIQRKTISKEWF